MLTYVCIITDTFKGLNVFMQPCLTVTGPIVFPLRCRSSATSFLTQSRRSSLGGVTTREPSGAAARRSTLSLTSIFINWLKESPRSEERKLLDIPAEELDDYLATFFSNVRRRDGSNYLPKSFKTIREAITRHLKETGYPHYIVQSPLFSKSQQAFKRRFYDLRKEFGIPRPAVINKT